MCGEKKKNKPKEQTPGEPEDPKDLEDPEDPDNKDKNKLIRIRCIFGGSVLVALAAPIAIPAAVGALGFGTGGIVAGTAGATMMSWGAGVTPAFVSVCQSIGATGAIAASTSVTIGATTAAVGLVVDEAVDKITKFFRKRK